MADQSSNPLGLPPTVWIALIVGLGEVLGGVFSPTIAGRAADTAGLSAPLWIMFGLCIGAGLLAMGLRETAPAVLKAKAG